MSDLINISVILASLIGFAILLNAVQTRAQRRKLPRTPSSQFREKIKHRFIIGTDNDLKMELIFILYLVVIICIVNRGFRARAEFQTLPAFVSLILGFHFRQWLSKWRFFNIISIKRLSSDSLFVWKPNSTTAFVITNIMIWYLLLPKPILLRPPSSRIICP